MGLNVVDIQSKDVQSGRKQDSGALSHTPVQRTWGTLGTRGWAGGLCQHRIDPDVPFIYQTGLCVLMRR